MKKVLITLLIFALFMQTGAATINDLAIVNLFPDEESTERNTQVVARLEADSTTTTNVTLYVQRPDGEITRDGTAQLTVKNGAPREDALRAEAELLTQYGEYKFIVNETADGQEDTINFTITPRPVVDIKVGDLVKDPAETNLDYIHVNVNPLIGRSISEDDFSYANFTVFQITNTNTSADVSKKQVISLEPTISNTTGDLEAVVDFSGLDEGAYEILVEFNLSSCATCPEFREIESTSIRVRNDSVSNMSSQLGVVLSLLFAGFLFAFIGSKIDTSNRLASVLRVFMFLLAPLFAVVAVFTGGHFATQSGFVEVGSYMNLMFLGTFFAWFFFMFVVGVVMYLNESFRIAVMGRLTGDDRDRI